MGSEKRQRQKANRAARLEKQAKVAKRRRVFRTMRSLAIVAVIVFAAALLISFLSGSDSDDTTTTTADPAANPQDTTTTTSTTGSTEPSPTSYELFAEQPTACGGTRPDPPADLSFEGPEDQGLDPAEPVAATITTSCGDITLSLDPGRAPEAVNSFVFLARQGYFDGTALHRIFPGFVIQGGDPTATGRGGPGYRFADELPPAGTSYSKGIVAMANSGPDSNGSQFFLAVDDTPLQANFTIFGEVVGSEDTLAAITAVPLGLNATGEASRPLESVYVESVTIG